MGEKRELGRERCELVGDLLNLSVEHYRSIGLRDLLKYATPLTKSRNSDNRFDLLFFDQETP